MAQQAGRVAVSGTSVFYGLIERAKKYSDVVNMGRGDLDLDTPLHIRKAVADALLADEPPAAWPTTGDPALRQAIARRARALNGLDVDPETEVLVTNGGQEAVFLIVQAAVGPGDEVLAPDPNYNTYADAITFAGATRVLVPTKVGEDFRIDPERVRAAITPRSRALLMVSPNNPTANVIAPDVVRALVAIAEEHDLMILADDTYDRFLYDGAEHLSPGSLPGAEARTLTINTASKTYAMTGWRLGWITGPADWIRQATRLKEGTSGATSVVAQRAALAALSGPQEIVAEMHETYKRRRRITTDALDRTGLRYGKPLGGQFVYVDLSPAGVSSVDLANRLLDEHHILMYPGAGFGTAWGSYVRITFLQPEEVLADCLRKIEGVLHDMTARGA
ncbi:MAG: pyridoxal phosphate-dependent aminotransferase [Armatimonadetes bacterium]|nr:pyridoxal phosphate-dependent aminotransferase [Armatimonadota bacterium]